MSPPRSWALRTALRLFLPMAILGCFFVWPCYELRREESSRTVAVFLVAYAVGGTLTILPFVLTRRKGRAPAPWKLILGSALIVFLLWPLLVFQGAVFGLLIALLYKPRPDTDVTLSPEHNFKPFAGTQWKTKVKVALADISHHKWKNKITLLEPRAFDRTHPEYTPPPLMEKVDAVLPVGTPLRIERLMKSHGMASFLSVTASLEDGRVVYLSDRFVAKNRFLWQGWSASKVWDADSDLLEKAE